MDKDEIFMRKAIELSVLAVEHGNELCFMCSGALVWTKLGRLVLLPAILI